MALITTLPEVQQWLEQSKLTVENVEQPLHDHYRDVVLSRLFNVYTTSGWVSVSTTPSLVRKIIAMLMASVIYRRAYSEDNSDDDSYGGWLESSAMSLLDGLAGGSLQLPEEEAPVSASGQPVFWPTDSTATLEPGNGLVGSDSDRKFTMGMAF